MDEFALKKVPAGILSILWQIAIFIGFLGENLNDCKPNKISKAFKDSKKENCDNIREYTTTHIQLHRIS